MPRPYVTAAEHRRKANRATALVLIIVTAACAIALAWPHDASASYNHISVCKYTLRGYYGDNDVHNWGVSTGALSFGGWGGYGHYSDGSAYVWGYFNYSYGKVSLARGRCSGGDYVADWFQAS